MKVQFNHRVWRVISLALAVSAGNYLGAVEGFSAPERPSPIRHEKPSVTSPASLHTYEMAPFLVQEPMMKGLGPQAQEIKDRPFSFVQGGTLIDLPGRKVSVELKCQYYPTHRGWDLLRINW